jgi:hypothetical protein
MHDHKDYGAFTLQPSPLQISAFQLSASQFSTPNPPMRALGCCITDTYKVISVLSQPGIFDNSILMPYILSIFNSVSGCTIKNLRYSVASGLINEL